jgi:hypothetical protein
MDKKTPVVISLNNIDWSLLREQKLWLIHCIDVMSYDNWKTENIEGVLALLDSIQDQAAEILGEEIVFGVKTTCE